MADIEIEHKNGEPARKECGTSAGNIPATSIRNSIGMEFVLIPAGELRLDPDEFNYEIQACKVIIPEPFYLGKYPVTQKEWKTVMGNYPSCFEGEDRPVECVSWNDVQDFVKKLNLMEDTDKYRLPSETQWEYACRAGTDTRYFFGDSELELGEYAWFYDNSEHMTHPVGRKRPNQWGLYDMNGNVWEWCRDKYHRNYEEALAEGTAWEAVGSIGIVLRGGGWVNYPEKCRCSYRSSFDSDYGSYSLGFRLLRLM